MQYQKASNIDVKKLNKNRIFRYVYENGKVSKQDIVAALGMSLPTVLQNVKELANSGLIEEVGEFESTGGRKAKAIASIPDARLAIGLEITRNQAGIVLANLQGDVLHHVRSDIPFVNEPAYYSQVGTLIDDLIKAKKVRREKVLGVGISIPGIISEDNRCITDSHVLRLYDFDCDAFTRNIPFECWFVNDANAASAAELRNRSEMDDAVYLSLSNSVGGGIFLRGSLYPGINQRSGEFGHMRLIPGGRPCYCGKIGCVDAYCAATVLSAAYQGDLKAFFNALDAGDTRAKVSWDEYLEHLAVTINNLRMAFDCSVILGGYVGGYLEKFLPELRRRAAELNTFEPDGDYVSACRFKEEAAGLGAALHFIDTFISQI